jgi:hypothetical protein
MKMGDGSTTRGVEMATTNQLGADAEIQRIERWRRDALERAGYPPADALELAVRHDVDLHRAVRLLQQGCSPELALRILL